MKIRMGVDIFVTLYDSPVVIRLDELKVICREHSFDVITYIGSRHDGKTISECLTIDRFSRNFGKVATKYILRIDTSSYMKW